jgi:prepilin-type N-terminal cleavage/methylation domain-containing protein
MSHWQTQAKHRQRGFSLVELMVSILVLVIVVGAVFSQVNHIQRNTQRESMKLDLTQENRDFVDQFVRDLHMSGYPVASLYQYKPVSQLATESNVALGLVRVSPTDIRFEGDVYGDGNVYSVVYQYYQVDPNVPPDPNCPCLRRSAQLKQTGDSVTVKTPGGQLPPLFYTEVQNIIDPAGMQQGLFTFYDANGNQIVIPAAGVDINTGAAIIQQIDAVKVNLNTRSKQYDARGQQVVNSIATIAELEN